ncbi:MAG TPA: magnesium/cobalt transporter CorA [Polyangiales bacterium]|nr:magnesium/cobalt transporter CorA [Polyangiales bacterium]
MGAPPGSIIPGPGVPRPEVHVIAYGPDRVDEYSVGHVSELKSLRNGASAVTWINIVGLGDSETFSQLGEIFGLHALALEDVVNVHQRPKFEAYEGTDFIVLRMPSLDPAINLEQVSMFVRDQVLITVQETPGDCLDGLRERIRNNKGRVRQRGVAYLAYAVVDAIVEKFFPVVEHYTDRLEALEISVLATDTSNVVAEIHAIRHDLRTLRRAVAPTREVVGSMDRAEVGAEGEDIHVFLRDCHDHTIQLLDSLDTNRELASSLMDIHLSNVSMRMNEVMKVLTIIATIFMPLGFIAGLYGMNFDGELSPWNMPELRWKLGYPFALALMGLTAIGLAFFFRKKGWLGENGVEAERLPSENADR